MRQRTDGILPRERATQYSEPEEFRISKRERRSVPGLLTCLVLLTGCGTREASPHSLGEVPTFTISTPVILQDDTASVLAQPLFVSATPSGVLLVADQSDKNIKAYTSAGQRVATIGAVGRGPGELESLTGGQALGDSIVAYDFLQQRLTVFDHTGQVARQMQLSPPPFGVRIVDDSLLLLVRHPGQGGKLLSIAGRDGTKRSRFLDLDGMYADPQLKHYSAVLADARDGFVFGTIFGEDSIFVFDYHGKLLATGRIPSTSPLGSIRLAFQKAGWKLKGADGNWFHQGISTVMQIIALDGGRAALQIATYDTKVGTDLVDGGEILIVGVRDGAIVGLAGYNSDAGLFGRAADGSLLFLKYVDSSQASLAIERWELQ
jgi:hypothetical protein